jgi:hypothetical protein
MNVFIILSILVIVIGVILLVSSPPVLFKLNWEENTHVRVLRYFSLYNKYHFLDHQININRLRYLRLRFY